MVTTELPTVLLHEDDAQLFSLLLALLPRAAGDTFHCVLAHLRTANLDVKWSPCHPSSMSAHFWAMNLSEPWFGVLVVTGFYMGCEGSPVMEPSAGALSSGRKVLNPH